MMKPRRHRLATVVSSFGHGVLKLAAVLTDRKVLILLGVLALGAYLRLWNIHHLFNAIHDYDEGIYALAARFISQGYLPYQDFTLAHPPLHTLTLASIYKVLGYDFFYSKYLSVALSLASVVVIYLTGKRMYHPCLLYTSPSPRD